MGGVESLIFIVYLFYGLCEFNEGVGGIGKYGVAIGRVSYALFCGGEGFKS